MDVGNLIQVFEMYVYVYSGCETKNTLNWNDVIHNKGRLQYYKTFTVL